MNKRKPNYYRVEMVKKRGAQDEVTIRKIEQGEERIVTGEMYIRDGNGEPYKFYTKEEAVTWLNKYIISELIDDEYRLPDQRKFLNDDGLKEVYGEGKEKDKSYIRNDNIVEVLKA